MNRSAEQVSPPAAGSETGRRLDGAGSDRSATRLGDGGAPARAGRFQRGFVTGVALLLGLTGGVKLVGVLQEARVLGAADPLFPFLTLRQVLFLAAVLELGVAGVLLRHRAARWAPGLILWLVLGFGAYRLGRWLVGREGSCGCLGHLLERWPEFERWGDRVMLAALVVLGTGSAALVLHRFRRPLTGRRPFKAVNSNFKSLMIKDLHVLVNVACLWVHQIFCITQGDEITNSFTPLLQTVNLETSQGAIFVTQPDLKLMATQEQQGLWGTLYVWDHGAILAATGVADPTNFFTIPERTLADGLWHGTNWSYAHGTITLITEITPGSNLARMISEIGGERPAIAAFHRILGRGLLLSEFKNLQLTDHTFRGTRIDGLTITGIITRLANDYTYRIHYSFEKSSQLEFQHDIELVQFAPNAYLPRRLQTSTLVDGVPVDIVKYEVLALTNRMPLTTLSPFELFPNAILLAQRGDRLFEETGKELLRRPPTHPQDLANWRVTLVRMAVIAFLLGGIIFFIFMRAKSNH